MKPKNINLSKYNKITEGMVNNGWIDTGIQVHKIGCGEERISNQIFYRDNRIVSVAIYTGGTYEFFQTKVVFTS